MLDLSPAHLTKAAVLKKRKKNSTTVLHFFHKPIQVSSNFFLHVLVNFENCWFLRSVAFECPIVRNLVANTFAELNICCLITPLREINEGFIEKFVWWLLIDWIKFWRINSSKPTLDFMLFWENFDCAIYSIGFWYIEEVWMANRLKEDEKNERIIRGLLKLQENRRCINCNSLVCI